MWGFNLNNPMYAQVIVDISNDAVDRCFDYVALPNTEIGMRVKVPFANRAVLGYVIGLNETTNVDKSKIKSIISNLESVPKLKPEILQLCKFMAGHFFLRLSDCIKLVLPSCVRLDSQHEQTEFVMKLNIDVETAINVIGKRAKNQLSAVAFLSEQGECKFSKLVELFGRQSINALVEKGIVNKISTRKFRTPDFTPTIENKKILP